MLAMADQRSFRQILLTGGVGTLGQVIQRSGLFPGLIAPPSKELDIRDPIAIERFFEIQRIDAVIHAAAFARLAGCEKDPASAIHTNIIGTSNLVQQVLCEETAGRPIRFVHISSDGVYGGTDGNYAEDGPTVPQTAYGWSKLGAECSVNLLKNFCIIRTRFFDPSTIRFTESATDIFTSKIPAADLVEAIRLLLNSSFVGTINVGGKRVSDFDCHKVSKPDLRPCRRSDIVKNVPFTAPTDVSMNVERWQVMKALCSKRSR